MKRKLEKPVDILESATAALIALSVLLIALQIIFRYALGKPLTWTEQLARYVFIWVCMLGVPVAVYKGATFSFDLVVKVLPAKVREVIKILVSLINMFFSSYWCYWTVQLVEKGGWRMTEGVKVKMGVLYSAQVVCALCLFVIILSDTITSVKALAKREGENK